MYIGDDMKPLVLCIMDGIGEREEIHGNAVKVASTPNLDKLKEKYGFSLLEASGIKVGLPDGQMGNSEVGHTNIGAGRVVYQPLQLITENINNGSLFQNRNLLDVINHTKDNRSKLHIMGLLSDGGIHSHIDHLMGIIDMCVKENVDNIYFHIFLDGRDTLPDVAYKYVEQLDNKIKEINMGTTVTVSGRYYAMDRDDNWDRVKKSYDAIVLGIGEEHSSAKETIDSNYQRGIYDEFIVPSIIDKSGVVDDNDGMIVFNYRPDRLRCLFTALTNPNFNGFERKLLNNIKLITMMPVSDTVICTNAFELQKLNNTLGDYLSLNGLKQLRIAETEKYAHVTYFFDGGLDKDIPNCDRILIPSPKVATYDLKPEMSAYLITDKLLNELDAYDVIILNYANGDMVGHTGNFDATVKAVEVVDECVGKLYDKVNKLGGTLIVTADHGNSDYMLDDNNNIITSHSTSLVPFIITCDSIKVKNGKLGDIAPTMLKLLDLPIPEDMSGEVLFDDKF